MALATPGRSETRPVGFPGNGRIGATGLSHQADHRRGPAVVLTGRGPANIAGYAFGVGDRSMVLDGRPLPLNIAEIEFSAGPRSALARQCLNRRIGSLDG